MNTHKQAQAFNTFQPKTARSKTLVAAVSATLLAMASASLSAAEVETNVSSASEANSNLALSTPLATNTSTAQLTSSVGNSTRVAVDESAVKQLANNVDASVKTTATFASELSGQAPGSVGAIASTAADANTSGAIEQGLDLSLETADGLNVDGDANAAVELTSTLANSAGSIVSEAQTLGENLSETLTTTGEILGANATDSVNAIANAVDLSSETDAALESTISNSASQDIEATVAETADGLEESVEVDSSLQSSVENTVDASVGGLL